MIVETQECSSWPVVDRSGATVGSPEATSESGLLGSLGSKEGVEVGVEVMLESEKSLRRKSLYIQQINRETSRTGQNVDQLEDC